MKPSCFAALLLMAYLIEGQPDRAAASVFTLPGNHLGNRTIVIKDVEGGAPTALAMSGNYILMGEGRTVGVYDVSDPSSPQRVAAHWLDGIVSDIQILGNFAYVGGYGGLRVLDITDPSAPALASTPESSGLVDFIAISGSRIVTTGTSVRFYTAANPASPVLRRDLAGTAQMNGDVVISGTYAFFGGGAVVNISNMANPVQVGFMAPVVSGSVFVNGNLAYIGSSQLRTYDISNPASPAFLGQQGLLGSFFEMSVAGGRAYVTYSNGLQIYDASNPIAWSPLSNIPLNSARDHVITPGSVAFSSEDEGLSVYDASNGASPAFLGECEAAGVILDLVLEPPYLYGAGQEPGIKLFDVSDPANPEFLNAIAGSPAAFRMQEEAGRLYVLGLAGIEIRDLANPTVPPLLGSIPISGTPMALAVRNQRVFAANTADLRIYDASNPASPALLATLPGADGEIFVRDDNTVFVWDQVGKLLAIDISNLASPATTDLSRSHNITGLSFLDRGGAPYLMLGSRLFPDPFNGGMLVFDAADYFAPSLLHRFEFFQSGMVSLKESPDYVYLTAFGSSTTGLYVYQMNDINAPVFGDFAPLPGDPYDLEINGEISYVAMASGGVVSSTVCQTDLSLELEPEFEFARAGRTLALASVIKNLGPLTATTATLVLDAGPGVSLIEPDPPNPACEFAGQTLTCSLGNLASGANLNRQFVLHAAEDATETISLVGSLAAESLECDGSNNAISIQIPVFELSSARGHWRKFR